MELKHAMRKWWCGVVALCGMGLSVAVQASGNGATAQNNEVEATVSQPVVIQTTEADTIASERITLFDAFTLGETIPLPKCPQNRWSSFGKGCVYLPERLEIFEDLPIASMVDRLGLYEYREGQYPAVASTSHMFTLGVDEQDRLMYLRVTTRGLDVENEVMQMLTAELGEPKVFFRRENEEYDRRQAPDNVPRRLWGVSSLGSVIVIWHNNQAWARYVSGFRSSSERGYFDIGLNLILKDGGVPDEFW